MLVRTNLHIPALPPPEPAQLLAQRDEAREETVCALEMVQRAHAHIERLYFWMGLAWGSAAGILLGATGFFAFLRW